MRSNLRMSDHCVRLKKQGEEKTVRCEDGTGRREDKIYASEAKRNATGARRLIKENWFDEAELPVAEGAGEDCERVGGIKGVVGVVMMGVTELLGVGVSDVVTLTSTEVLSGRMDGNVSVFNTDVGVGLPSSGKVSVTLGSVGSGEAVGERVVVVAPGLVVGT